MPNASSENSALEASTRAAMTTAAVIAFRHIMETRESEREAVLVALVELLPETEAKLAEEALLDLRNSNNKQLQLLGILDADNGQRAARFARLMRAWNLNSGDGDVG